MAAVALSMAVLAMTGCLPWPHRANLTPPILGELRGPDGPITGVGVRASTIKKGDPCGPKFVESTTNDQGRFALPAVRYLNWWLVVMGHRHFEWNLCVHHEGAWTVAHHANDYTLGDTGPAWTLTVICEDVGADQLGFRCRDEHDWDAGPSAATSWLTGR